MQESIPINTGDIPLETMRQFALTFGFEKIIEGPSMEPYVNTVKGWVSCTDEEESTINGIPVQLYARNGVYTYSTHAFGVVETDYSTYLIKMVEAIRNGALDGLEADSANASK
jgi:hypothetical protein